MDSNHRPHAYQACALTGWAIGPCRVNGFFPLSAFAVSHFSALLICLNVQLLCLYIQKWTKYSDLLSFVYFVVLHVQTRWVCTFKNKQYTVLIDHRNLTGFSCLSFLLRKEVIQPHLPIRLPCYDFTPIINPTFDCCLLAVSSQASGVIDSHGVTGGVYKARERIHRDILIRDY